VVLIFFALEKLTENSLSRGNLVLGRAVHREVPSYWRISFIKQLTMEVLEEGAGHCALHKPDTGVPNDPDRAEVSQVVRPVIQKENLSFPII
jgi:hypothetical protein